MDETEPLPPIPSRIRLHARYRGAPKARKDISLRLFLLLILTISAMGWHGINSISRFLYLMDQRYSHPTPTPTPGIEIRFEPLEPSEASK
jgi:hypothetical protein